MKKVFLFAAALASLSATATGVEMQRPEASPTTLPYQNPSLSAKERALENAIPEFLRFNIVENEVRNVV